MAIAHDTDARFPSSLTLGDTTTGDRSFTYTPVGTPAGVVVVVMCLGTAQPCTGVTYGGAVLSLIANATDTSEAGSVWIFALTDVAIPTGAQTVVLQGCIAASKVATVSTVTSATGYSTVNTNNSKNTTTAANPTISILTTDTAIFYGAIHGGAASPASYVAGGADITIQYDMDYGALSARSARGTSPLAAGSHTFDFSFATSDDYCISVVAIAEASAPATNLQQPFVMAPIYVGERR